MVLSPQNTDYGHPERAFFQKFEIFGLGQTNWELPNTLKIRYGLYRIWRTAFVLPSSVPQTVRDVTNISYFLDQFGFVREVR